MENGNEMMMEWSDDLSVGVFEIDNQHKELIDRKNSFFRSVKEGKGSEELVGLIRFLEVYIVSHFGLEETYMMKYNYPGYLSHKGAHKDFMGAVFDIRNRLKQQGPSGELVHHSGHYIVRWLSDHITGPDREFGSFLKERLSERGNDTLHLAPYTEEKRFRPSCGENEQELLKILNGVLDPGVHEVVLFRGQQTAWLRVSSGMACDILRSAGEGKFIILNEDCGARECADSIVIGPLHSAFRIIAGGESQGFRITVRPL